MSRKEIQKILDRDLRGWKLAPNATLPPRGENEFMVKIEKGSLKKSVLISGGRVSAAQG